MGIASTFGRTIRYLRVAVVDRCNLRCTYCMPAGDVDWLPEGERLTADEIERVVRCAVAAGVAKVRLTGGEPLVRPDLPELVSRLRRIPGLEELTLTTNATLLGRRAGALRAAGLDRLNVSLDSLRPATFAGITRGGSLYDVLAGLEAADAAGFPIKLNTVVMRGVNDGELGVIARFALARGWHARFIEYMPVGCGTAAWRERFVPAGEIVARLEASLGRLEPEPAAGGGSGRDPARRFRVRGRDGSVGVIAPVTAPFCAACDRLRLTADGRLRSCLLAAGEVDVRPLLRGGAPDGEIVAALRRAAGLKPEWHGIAADGASARVPQRAMCQIGG